MIKEKMVKSICDTSMAHSHPIEPYFILRGNNETTVNFVKFLRDPISNTTFLWTANGDGKGASRLYGFLDMKLARYK